MTRVRYGAGLYNHDLRKHAKEYLSVLPKDISLLASMGSSGCAIASAMLALSKRHLYHIQYRKQNEKSHSSFKISPYPFDTAPKGTKTAIVDDFIETGDTINKLINHVLHDGLQLEAIIVSHINRHQEVDKYHKQIDKYNLIDIEDL